MREKLGNWGCCMFVSSKLHLWRYQAQIWSCMSVLPRPHMTLIVQVLIHKMVASTIQNSPFKSKHPESLLSYWICSGLRNKKQGIHSYSHSLHYHQIISHSAIYILYYYVCIYIYTTLPCFMAILKNLHIKNLGFTMFHGHLWFHPPRRHRGARRARPRLPKSSSAPFAAQEDFQTPAGSLLRREPPTWP